MHKAVTKHIKLYYYMPVYNYSVFNEVMLQETLYRDMLPTVSSSSNNLNAFKISSFESFSL